MEKISNIVRGSPRVASVDLKRESAVRPGAPSFGRPIGESPHSEKIETTAQRATALQTELNEKRNTHDGLVKEMSDNFFMNRVKGSQVMEEPAIGKAPVQAKIADADVEEELHSGELHEAEIAQPQGYVPRGTFVNVHA